MVPVEHPITMLITWHPEPLFVVSKIAGKSR